MMLSTASPNEASASVPANAVHGAVSSAAPRLTSLDAFRGLVILTMTFVNYLAGVSQIPAWAKHLPPDAEGYTFVDVVFPGFLFIVGVAIPLALHKRLARGDSVLGLLRRVLERSASLILVGVIMVNTGAYSAQATGLSKPLYYLLTMLSVVVLWNLYPAAATQRQKRIYLGLRCLAGLTLAVMLVLFRGKNAAGETVWMAHSWWGILGLIGWAYLVACLSYLGCKGNSTALMGILGFLLALYIGDRHGALDWLGPVHSFIGVGAVLGSTAADVVMGVLVGNCFVGPAASSSPAARARFFLLFGLGLYLAGSLLRPLHGINKVAATEAYALVTGGVCCLAFLLVYWVMDVWQCRAWARPLIPIGENALLAYLLPGLLGNFLAVIGCGGLLWHYSSGWPGAINTALLTALIGFITWVATKAGIRLRL